MAQRDLQKDLETMKDNMAKLSSDIAELAQKVIETGKGEAGTAKNKVETQTRNLGQKLRQTLNDTGEQSQEAVESVKQLLTEKPLISVFAAFGLGLLFGKLWGGGRS